MPLSGEKKKNVFYLLLTFAVTQHFFPLEEPAWEPAGEGVWEIGFAGFQP